MSEPVLIPFPPPPTPNKLDPDVGPYAEVFVYPPRTLIVQVSIGMGYMLAVSKAGHVYNWGDGRSCELGLTVGGDDDESVVQQKTPKRSSGRTWIIGLSRTRVQVPQHCVLLVRKLEGYGVQNIK
ncbi:hypothetical protein FRC10_008032 [Ceratobasidium sp. 414]|nr:hypothetical protein FRC10_008032 [Ceratobasidium sp. 414]